MAMTQERAETVALQVLSWIAGNEDLLPVFLGASGGALEDMRAGAHDPEFLAAVMDFVLMDDDWVVACCDDCGLGYETLAAARQLLPGGAPINWT